jgi:hypothetical protein
MEEKMKSIAKRVYCIFRSPLCSPAGKVDALVAARRTAALVDVVAIEFIVTAENEAMRAAALVASFSIYANMRAVVDPRHLTFIHVMTSEAIRAERKSRFASTAMRADEINADIRAVSVVLDTLINIEAGKTVLVQLVAFVTRAGEATLGVYATLLAST